MAHQLLAGSDLLIGIDFTQNEKVLALCADKRYLPMLLFPSPSAIPLSTIVQKGLTPLIFILDGTWSTAKSMLKASPNLKALPRVTFNSTMKGERRSRFAIKRQPEALCLSTIEAIDECLKILDPNLSESASLMKVFDTFVQTQLKFISHKGKKADRGER